MLDTRLLYAFTYLFFFGALLQAQTYRLSGDYYIRSSPNFLKSDKNEVGALLRGSSFRVLNKVKLNNGAEGLEIRVVGLTEGSEVKPSPSYWIYKSSDNRDFIKLETETEAQAGAVTLKCLECRVGAAQTTSVANQNTNDLANISQKTIDQDNRVSAPVAGSLDAKIKAYSQSNAVKNTIEYGLKHRKPRSIGKCHRGVKNALACTERSDRPGPGNCLNRAWYPGVPALGAKESLKKLGFINLLEIEPYKSSIGNSPSKAPKGSVLVYTSGIPCGDAPDCGHVEIKTNEAGKPGYVSDYYSADAINQTPAARRYGSRFKLVGVMVKI
jgi:hypothetical protein